MQRSVTEVELDKLAALCGSLRLHGDNGDITTRLLDPIASALGAESAAFRHLELKHARPRILKLSSIGVPDSVSDDYLAHFHRFDPFLDRMTRRGEPQDQATPGFPFTGSRFERYYHDFLLPNDLVRHAGFLIRDLPGQQAWIFNFHRCAASPDFDALEQARARLIEACLQGQAFRLAQDDDMLAGFNTSMLQKLSMREQDIGIAVARGLGNKQIAASLGISSRTVENHLRNIYDKLHINTRTQLVSLLYKPDYNLREENSE